MGYYMGDYRIGMRGRRFKGDPGFLSFLGGIAKAAVGFIPGVGPIASKALEMIPTGGSAIVKAAPGAVTTASRIGTSLGKMTGAVGRGIVKHPVLTAAGAAGAAGLAGAAIEHRLMGHKKHRRMRVTNPKALRRALRRADGFARFAMHCIKLTHPHKKGRFGGFKIRRKKKACA